MIKKKQRQTEYFNPNDILACRALSTRISDFLADSGEIRRLETAGSIKRFDGDMSPHQHVRCVFCGHIGDVMETSAAPSVEGMRVEGFAHILNSRVEYDGICEACARQRAVDAAAERGDDDARRTA